MVLFFLTAGGEKMARFIMEKRVFIKAFWIGLSMGAVVSCVCRAQVEEFTLSYEQVIQNTMKPFEGPCHPEADVSTLSGKVMCGYQGWFTCPGDGSAMGWFHWGLPTSAPATEFCPGRCKIDLWPDMSEYDSRSRVPTLFRHANGETAYVYSSMDPAVADLHFRWMKEYGIDGVFVQRFAAQTFKPMEFSNVNIVLANCRAAANRYGRAYALMYDLSGMRSSQFEHILNDVRLLADKMRLFDDPADKAYLHHRGKPLIAVWGVGFGDRRQYGLKDCERLIRFLKTDPQYGKFSVMLGVPTYWREQGADAVKDKDLHRILQMADLISPWTVGRVKNCEEVHRILASVWREDILWCENHQIEYVPVVFPGFSWHNMHGGPLNQIPRCKGQFFWTQIFAAKKAGAEMIYVAMFDEVDEATAIYKCTNNPPVGESAFLTYEGLPSDYYLRLAGRAGKLLRSEIPLSESLPLSP